MRLGPLAVAAVLLLAVTGCGPDLPAPTPAPEPPVRPAALAGGACQLVDFATFDKVLGDHYTVAAAAKNNKTNTCVVRTEQAAYPEVSVSVTPSKVDTSVFGDVVKPKAAKAVAGVGRSAYLLTTAAKGDLGPILEVGWLTGDARLFIVHWTLPAGADPAAAEPKVVALAKELDKSSL
ncbi:hypothetical protein [Hamadaea tsunoensis]|uniref:hypothetical protein n=1 Tax=Hamadaea tsunoensis TaxID=53368 RepID=UPI0003F8CBB1|nr:hypothetical protein [Hamadaea tsunoensis]